MRALAYVVVFVLLLATFAQPVSATEQQSRHLIVPVLAYAVFPQTPEYTEEELKLAIENMSEAGLGPQCKMMAEYVLAVMLMVNAATDRGLTIGFDTQDKVSSGLPELTQACRSEEGLTTE